METWCWSRRTVGARCAVPVRGGLGTRGGGGGASFAETTSLPAAAPPAPVPPLPGSSVAGCVRGCVCWRCQAQLPASLIGIRKSHPPFGARQPHTLGPGTFSLALVALQASGAPHATRAAGFPVVPSASHSLGLPCYLHVPFLHPNAERALKGMPRELEGGGTRIQSNRMVLGCLRSKHAIAAGRVILPPPLRG